MHHDPAHSHDFDHGNRAAERGTRVVLWITLAMMLGEIIAGMVYRSMALLADGWHMGSHAVAIGLSTFAYTSARRLAADPRFAFGSWKIEVLAGYTSAVFLLGVAGIMVVASVERLLFPAAIHYEQALGVAVLGLLVNLLCAWILGRAGHHHHHGHGHDHHGHHGHDHHDHHGQHGHGHHDHGQGGHHHGHTRSTPHSPDGDLNLHAARLHVIADAATSVLAIVALLGGLHFGWSWLDPAMGLVGAVLVTRWAIGLLREGSRILLDREMDHPLAHELRGVVAHLPEAASTHVTDLHVWRIGRHQFACVLRLATTSPTLTALAVREHLAHYPALVHATVEIDYSPSP
ncbi:MAG: Co/Zn/Cd efflux system component [Pseudomonadota bacterium]